MGVLYRGWRDCDSRGVILRFTSAGLLYGFGETAVEEVLNWGFPVRM